MALTFPSEIAGPEPACSTPLRIAGSIRTMHEEGQIVDILVRSSAELKSAFANADAGDVIKLASGTYDSVRLRDRDFDSDVTITSADPGNRAVFRDDLELNDVSGVTVAGIDIDAGSLASSAYFSRFQVVKSQDVTLRDISIEGYVPNSAEGRDPSSASRLDPIAGYGHENGLRIRWSDDITLEGLEFTDLRQAVSVQESNGTRIAGLEIHRVREGINLNDVDDTLIEDSWFHDFAPFHRDHPDMIQFWGTDSGVHGLTVRGNLLEQPEGWTQSIFGHFNNRPDHVTGSDFVITGNTIINAHPNAIRIREIDGFEISNNTLLPNDPDYSYRKLPKITVLDSQNGEVTGNVLLPRWDGSILNLGEEALRAANIDAGGNVSLSTNPGDELFWQNLIDGGLSIDIPTADGGEAERPDPEPDAPEQDESVDDAPPAAAEDMAQEPVGEEKEEPGDSGSEPDAAPGEILGTAGSDLLRDRDGDTSLSGLKGKDHFVFDYRSDTTQADDTIMDLDFSQRDRLVLITDEAGTFEDGADPENDLTVLHDGSRVHVQSTGDLLELAAQGAVSLGKSAEGIQLSLEQFPDLSIELVGLSPDDFLM